MFTFSLDGFCCSFRRLSALVLKCYAVIFDFFLAGCFDFCSSQF